MSKPMTTKEATGKDVYVAPAVEIIRLHYGQILETSLDPPSDDLDGSTEPLEVSRWRY